MATHNNDHSYKLSYTVGVAETANNKYRSSMEDVHTYVENFVERLDWGYFAIFDGHAGQQAAKWCGQHLHSILERKLLENESEDVRDLLNQSFVEADEQIITNVKGSSGCTAAVALLRWELSETKEDGDEDHREDGDSIEDGNSKDNANPTTNHLDPTKHKRMLYTANVGDTRIVLFRDNKAIRLTYDHKASDLHEINRIEKSGGLIMKSRVNGMLAVTRSLGDQFFKDLVIGNPYTTSVELEFSIDKFLIIACDGLWDVVSDQDACELIKDIDNPKVAAKALVNYAMSKSTTDNVTVMVINLKQN